MDGRRKTYCFLQKVCRVCGETKDRAQFVRDPAQADGTINLCKLCNRAIAKKKRDDAKARGYRYERSQEQKARCNETTRIWRHTNRQKSRSLRQAYKDRASGLSDGTVLPSVVAEMLSEYCGCPYCGDATRKATIDHMQPLALGGKHSSRNLIVCCSKCNSTKNGMSFLKWINTLPEENRAFCLDYFMARNRNAS